MRNKKKIIIIVLCMAVLLLAVVYAAFATKLTISSKGNITSNWNVYFESISSTVTGQAYNIETPSVSGATARFRVGLKLPGDKMSYRVKVTNGGTVDAYISDVKINNTGSTKVITTVTNTQTVKKGGKLAAGRWGYFIINIQLDPDATSLPEETVGDITIELVAVQYTDQEVKPEAPTIETKRLNSLILRDNTAKIDTDIDFSKVSSSTNGTGLYYTNTNTENNAKTYYFRGAVENNYVSFANNTWRIVRINEDGSIRLITQDLVGTSAFNDREDDNAYVGYMYGTPGSLTYAETHKNTNSSTIKVLVDEWYQDNLINYSNYLADAGFCGDRSIAPSANTWDSEDTALGYGSNFTVYGAESRLDPNVGSSDVAPQFKCPQSNDLYTTSSTAKGNKALTYPIGLITGDEVAYAGGAVLTENNNYYLPMGDAFWLISPAAGGSMVNVELVGDGNYWGGAGGNIDSNINSEEFGVRPVINLKSTVEVTEGDGTEDNPYWID